mmetsp:Transcript_18585/g.46374  ORF Transcript_18585/g.46374 Transcript_18585/m.46374 type:complete len:977 (+) Transcript_18585:208-3138(+)
MSSSSSSSSSSRSSSKSSSPGFGGRSSSSSNSKSGSSRSGDSSRRSSSSPSSSSSPNSSKRDSSKRGSAAEQSPSEYRNSGKEQEPRSSGPGGGKPWGRGNARGGFDPTESPKHFVPGAGGAGQAQWMNALEAKEAMNRPSAREHGGNLGAAKHLQGGGSGGGNSPQRQTGAFAGALPGNSGEKPRMRRDPDAKFLAKMSLAEQTMAMARGDIKNREMKAGVTRADMVAYKEEIRNIAFDDSLDETKRRNQATPEEEQKTGASEAADKKVKMASDATMLPKTDKFICVRTCGMIRGADFNGDFVLKLVAGTKVLLRRTKTHGYETKISRNIMYLPVKVCSRHQPELDGLEGWVPWPAFADADWVPTPRDHPEVVAAQGKPLPPAEGDQKRGMGLRIVYEMEKLRTDTKLQQGAENEHFYLAEVTDDNGTVQIKLAGQPRYKMGVAGEYTVDALELEKAAIERLPPEHKEYYLHLLEWMSGNNDISEKQQQYFNEMQDALHVLRQQIWKEGEKDRILVKAAIAKMEMDNTHMPRHKGAFWSWKKLGDKGVELMQMGPELRALKIGGSFSPPELEETFTPRERDNVMASAALLAEPVDAKMERLVNVERKPSRETFAVYRFQQPGTFYVNNKVPKKVNLITKDGGLDRMPPAEKIATALPLGHYEGVYMMNKGYSDVFCVWHLKLRKFAKCSLFIYLGVTKYMRRLLFKGTFEYTDAGLDLTLDDSPETPLSLRACTELIGDLRVSFPAGTLDKFLSVPDVHKRMMKGIRKVRLDWYTATTGKVPTVFGPNSREARKPKDRPWTQGGESAALKSYSAHEVNNQKSLPKPQVADVVFPKMPGRQSVMVRERGGGARATGASVRASSAEKTRDSSNARNSGARSSGTSGTSGTATSKQTSTSTSNSSSSKSGTTSDSSKWGRSSQTDSNWKDSDSPSNRPSMPAFGALGARRSSKKRDSSTSNSSKSSVSSKNTSSSSSS